jgi:hypothetical protein
VSGVAVIQGSYCRIGAENTSLAVRLRRKVIGHNLTACP